MWTIALVSTGVLGMWLAVRHWYGWAINVVNEVLWLAYAIATGATPLMIMACVWGAIAARNMCVAYRDEHPRDIDRELQGVRGDF